MMTNHARPEQSASGPPAKDLRSKGSPLGVQTPDIKPSPGRGVVDRSALIYLT